jgi:glutathione S-transferase
MSNYDRPVLWHIAISHFSEKVRWALAYKGADHEIRAPMPGVHMPLALWLTRGSAFTLPVIELDGRRIGDSTAIIAALERRHPDPPLYPSTAPELRRALALEDWFDESVGPYTRRLAFYEVGQDRALVTAMAARMTPGLARRLGGAVAPVSRMLTAVRYRAGDERAANEARSKSLAALDRLESELGDGEYLVGGRFTVADLTAAALLYPLVLPDEGPLPAEAMPLSYTRLRESISDRRAYRWVQEIFRRHRHAQPEQQGQPQGARSAPAPTEPRSSHAAGSPS